MSERDSGPDREKVRDKQRDRDRDKPRNRVTQKRETQRKEEKQRHRAHINAQGSGCGLPSASPDTKGASQPVSGRPEEAGGEGRWLHRHQIQSIYNGEPSN